MNKDCVLVIGSVVRLKGGIREVMIVQKYVLLMQNERQVIYDYGACLFPEGILGNTLYYFNQDDIQDVLFTGMKNDKAQIYDQIMTNYIDDKKIPHGKRKEVESHQ